MTDRSLFTWSDVVGNDLSAVELVELARASGQPLADWLRAEAAELYGVDDLEGLDFDRLAAELAHDAAEVVETQGKPTAAPVSYTCDLCGLQSHDLAVIVAHLRDEHGVEDAGEVGSLNQEDGILALRSGDETMVVDLDAWLREALGQTPE